MARVLPLLLFFVGLLFVDRRAPAVDAAAQRPCLPAAREPMGIPRRGGGAYRRRRGRHELGGPASALDGLRDAYSSAAIDPDAPLWRCGGCHACYHRQSVQALESHNAGRCTLCGSDDLRPVQVV